MTQYPPINWDEPGIPIIPPPHPGFVSHVHWTGENRLLSPPECRELIRIGDVEGRLQSASVGNPGESRVDPSIRQVKSTALMMREAPWLYERIREKVKYANHDYYGFHLTGLVEPVQFLKYERGTEDKPDGHYGWHQDFGAGYMGNRKLSLVVQLSEPSDYDGCELHLMTHLEFDPGFGGQGEAVMFSTWTPHRVLPITRGTRYALAIWIHGPRFT